jgi:hypothetical protein
MSESANPYAAPTANVDDVSASPEKEAIRHEHINHEASIKAVGFLYYLGGIGVTVAAIASMAGGEPGAGMLLLILGAGQLVGGWGVRALRPWARYLGCVLSGIGLLGFPIGTLINAYVLYLLLSKKGRTVFAPEYQEVIEATPHVKYRTSIVVWICLALLAGLILLGVTVALFKR